MIKTQYISSVILESDDWTWCELVLLWTKLVN